MSAEALSGARCVQMQGPACMRAGADAPDGARCQGLMAYDSAAISTEVSDSMDSEGAACSHLHEGREGQNSVRLEVESRMGCTDGPELRSAP